MNTGCFLIQCKSNVSSLKHNQRDICAGWETLGKSKKQKQKQKQQCKRRKRKIKRKKANMGRKVV